jgi:hypothetical protein
MTYELFTQREALQTNSSTRRGGLVRVIASSLRDRNFGSNYT